MNDEGRRLWHGWAAALIALRGMSSEEIDRYYSEKRKSYPHLSPERLAEDEAMDAEISRALVENLNRNVLAEHEEDAPDS